MTHVTLKLASMLACLVPTAASAQVSKAMNGTTDGPAGLTAREFLNRDPAGLLNASEKRKGAVIEQLKAHQNVLAAEVARTMQDRRGGRISAVTAASALEEISVSIEVLQGAKSLLEKEPSPGAVLEPERLEEQAEALRWVSRPVWALCQGRPWLTGALKEEWAPILKPVEAKLAAVSRSVGVVSAYYVSPRLLSSPHVGSAVVVGPRLIATNKHVVRDGRFGYQDVASGEWKLFTTLAGEVEFPREYQRCDGGNSPAIRARVIGIEYADPSPEVDFIILRVDQDLPPHVRFADAPDVGDADRIAVIGYPGRPKVPFLREVQVDEIFGTPDKKVPFPVSRLSLGYVLPNDTAPAGHHTYDATTWGGSSGSAVMSLVDGSVISIHVKGMNSPKEGIGYNLGLSGAKIASWQKGRGL